ncbi:hypothetical protein [Rhodovulum marinum]|uniref:YpeB-like protein with protease inhibitory function n=1 Tax=Rhodovulum marinum TaxID=320662 RepID=A0A4R2Q511_9RHOB|nr:hypothetical protein [Rhodovulum marinum]TCP42994.1 hypothetical protein EV662_102186 [Rhodovulum marinum]
MSGPRPITARAATALGLAGALAPWAAFAEVGQSDLDALRRAMVDVGCLVDSAARAAAVETATGFDEAKLEEIAAALRARGEIEDQTGDRAGIRLISGDCAK